MIISTIHSVEDKQPSKNNIKTNEFLNLISYEKFYPTKICTNNQDKLAGDAFILAEYVHNTPDRMREHVHPDSSTELICFDVDKCTKEEIEEGLETWSQYEGCLYSTYKHTTDHPRIRLLFQLEKSIKNNDPNFEKIYHHIANLLNVKYDRQACKLDNVYFFPQTKIENEKDHYRMRFHGALVPTPKITDIKESTEENKRDGIHLSCGYRPPGKEIKITVDKLFNKYGKKSQVANMLSAIIDGRAFAARGERHDAMLSLTYQLASEWPLLDARWFYEAYMKPSIKEMTDTEQGDKPVDAFIVDWEMLIESAKVKDAENKRNYRNEIEGRIPDPPRDLTDKELQNVDSKKGALIVYHKKVYYIFNPYENKYEGVYDKNNYNVAILQYLYKIPGLVLYNTEKNKRVMRPIFDLLGDYGFTAQKVIYCAYYPDKNFNREDKIIYVQAYKFIDIKAKFDKFWNELLRESSGEKYSKLEQYLSQFTNLNQRLPALVLCGPRASWKSKICQYLAKFWEGNACKAYSVMGYFQQGLLNNPVIWSDEELAKTSMGKSMDEKYRESIDSNEHAINQKNMPIIQLNSVLRHVISVNDIEKVFTKEISISEIDATRERFLVINMNKEKIDAVEKKWEGTDELNESRENADRLLGHIQWIAENIHYKSEGRYYVKDLDKQKELEPMRFANPITNGCINIALEELKNLPQKTLSIEERKKICWGRTHKGYTLKSTEIGNAWAMSSVIRGTGMHRPSTIQISKHLQKIGIITKENNREGYVGRLINWNVLSDYIDQCEDDLSKENICKKLDLLFGIQK